MAAGELRAALVFPERFGLDEWLSCIVTRGGAYCMQEVCMATTLCVFETPVVSRRGQAYSARACGRQREDHLWEGWIEFKGADGAVLRSARETTQPNLTDLEYWAQGLTPVYLEGALRRALEPAPVAATEPPTAPAYSGPAGPRPQTPVAEEPEAVLNPYSVYQQGGLDLLLEELNALSVGHLRQIIRAHLLADENAALDSMNKAELIALIAQRVRGASRSATR